MSILEFRDVELAYEGGAPVLDGVSLTVERGQVIGLLGRNGAGKTTLIRIAMGMLEPRSGSVRVFGEDPRDDVVGVRSRLGAGFELPAGARIAKLSKGQARQVALLCAISHRPESRSSTNPPAASIPPPGASSWRPPCATWGRRDPRSSSPRTT